MTTRAEPMTFAERLRSLREANGLTQRQLGERAGLSENWVGQFECGRREPTFAVLLRLCRGLGVSLECFDGCRPRA